MKTSGAIFLQVATMAVAFIFVACFRTEAATITWTNTASGSWSVPANWNPNQVPGASDTAVITNGSVTVTLDIGPTVGGIILGADAGCGGGTTLLMNGQTLTLNGPFVVGSCGHFTVDSGTLSGAANATLSGVLGWGGGFLANLAGTLTLATNGTLNITAETYHDMSGGTLINNGTVRWTGGPVRGGPGTLIQNNGLWIAQVTNTINSALGPTPAFNNSGTFDVQIGTIDFSMAGTSTGTFHVAAGATCNFGTFSHDYNFDNGTAFTGAGTNRLNGYTYTLNGTITSQNLEFPGGTLTATNATLSGVMGWGGGFLTTLAGTLTLATNGTLNITAETYHDMPGGTLINNGTVRWTGGAVRGGTGTLIQNNGLWIAQVTNTINNGYGGTPAFNNSGTFDVQAGTIDFSMTGTNTGTFHVTAGATCNFNFNYNFNSGTAFTGAGTNRLNNSSTYTMNGAINSENLIFAAGTLSGAANATLSGVLGWGGGVQVYLAGTLTLATNSTLNITAENNHDMPGGALINNGTVRWTGGAVRGGTGTLIQNNGLWIAQVTNTINNGYGGTLAFNNSGTFDVQSGTVDFSMAGTNTGTFHVAAGATCNFNSSYNFNSGTALTGVGTNRLGGVGVYTLDGIIYVQNVEFTAGQLAGNHILSGSNGFAGSFTWIAGTMNTPGATTIASNATLSIVSANLHDLPFHTLTNNGTVVSSGGDVRGGDGCFIQNSGLWLIQADNSLSAAFGAGMGFNNTGIFRKTAGVGTNTVSCDFTNNGTVSAQSGTLVFSGNFTNPLGTLAVSGGSTLQFANPLVLPSGMVTGSGNILAPSITSAATVDPGAINAVLALSGSYTQLQGGTIQFEIGGTLPGTNQSQVSIAGPAHVDGEIVLQFSPGYSPVAGSSNIVLTANPLSGVFPCNDHFFLLGQNKRMVADYNPTNLTLVAVSAPDPALPALEFSLAKQFLVCWPSEFTNFSLYFKTNLAAQAWTPVPGATNHYLEVPSAPQKFFYLIK